ncbi:MAG: polyphosphate polymerase domain-containing protein [Oscillospiraceae bacterium]|jgi:hypothetical protein|nr:polyphosphate polymerase domain-containing protein [Oscillospiraceae bacterium]
MGARHEFKHSLNYGDYLVLRSRLAAIMHRDDNADEDGRYQIRSLYFDTPGDKALRDKINGADKREKFRLRRYIGHDIINLEKKSKAKGLCYKQAVRLTEAEVKALLSGGDLFVRDPERALLQEFYSKVKSQLLRPKTIVEYTREPYICAAGNVRITFDCALHTGLYCLDFLNDSAPLVPAGDRNVIMEIKYDRFIPDYIMKAIGLNARRAEAVSKYALCRVYG